MGRPTLMQDVARAANVHRSTVSLALRNNPRIPLETRRRIQGIAERLGYRTNPMVAALMQLKKSSRPLGNPAGLAYLTSHPGRYDWRDKRTDVPNFFPGAARQARELGYKLEDFWIAEPGMTGSRMSQILHARNILGVIVAPLPPDRHQIDLEWDEFCVVSIGVHLTQPRVHRVAHNHFHTMKIAVARCREAGFKRIGLYMPRTGYRAVWEQWVGAFSTERVGCREMVAPCTAAELTPETFYRWLAREQPDVIIFGGSDVQNWLAAKNLRVPQDVSLVNLHVPMGEEFLAGVHYDPVVTGAEAVNQVVALVNRHELGLPAQAHDFLIHGHWFEGQSLGRGTPAGRATRA